MVVCFLYPELGFLPPSSIVVSIVGNFYYVTKLPQWVLTMAVAYIAFQSASGGIARFVATFQSTVLQYW